jgi:diguanylate cyclase (GGDEF)-like protein
MDTIITGFDLPSIPIAVGLAAVATIGYIVGLRTRRRMAAAQAIAETPILSARPTQRTAIAAKELESIAEQLRRRLAEHHRSVAKFQTRVTEFCESRPKEDWLELTREAEDILKPTIKLASELAQAYDGIRRQSTQLTSQAGAKTDALTGVATRDALVEMLEMNLAMTRRYARPLAVAIIDIDNFSQTNEARGRAFGDRALRDTARAINDSIRNSDLVARVGGEEFVVVMPATNMHEAIVSAERLRQIIIDRTDLTVSIGIADATRDESQADLLARADVALNGAKAAGRNCVYAHDGENLIPFETGIDDIPISLSMTSRRRGDMATM